MHLRTFSTLLLSALSVVQPALGFPGGPGGCGTPPVAGLHLAAPTVIENTLAGAGITVSIDGVDAPSVQPLSVGTDVPIVVSANEGLTYRGILIRLERVDGVDVTGSLTSTDLADAAVCSAPVTGVGHSNNNDKTTNSATLRIDDVVDATLQITIVFSNSDGVSSYAFDEFNLSFVNPPCELCGCSFCEPGAFPITNPNGVIPIPEEFGDQAPPGFTEIPCSLLDFAAISGQIPPELCNDDLRLLPEFRQVCGCPALPPTEAPVASPTDMPIVAPTEAPVIAPTEAPVIAPTEAPVIAPTEAPVIAPTEAPVMAPTEAPAVAPTDMPITETPVVAPTEAPAVSLTEIPVATPTDAPLTETPIGSPTEAPVAETTNMPVPTTTESPVMAPTGPTAERCIRRKL